MMNAIQRKLNQYYKREGISSVDGTNDYAKRFRAFGCLKKDSCLCACKKWKQDVDFSPPIEDVCVSRYYTDRTYCSDSIPRIVVISLSAPEPSMPLDENSTKPLGSYTHWRETLAMVRSLLHPFIAPEKFPKPIENWEDEDITIVESLFVHARTAKCCSNAYGGEEEPSEVYENCGGYLNEEMAILKPDVIITQGREGYPPRSKARVERYVFQNYQKVTNIQGINPVHNVAHVATLKCNSRPVFWLQLYHPRCPRYYSQAGPKIDCESNCVGAMRENFVRYGKEIKKFRDNPKTYCTSGLPNAQSRSTK